MIVDYGMGNISSVYNALEFISPSNTKIYVSSERSEIKSADKIIFPGQGAAKSSIESLKKFNIIDDIKESATKKALSRDLSRDASSNGRNRRK